jgi:fructose-bisphosphate aldolase, class I
LEFYEKYSRCELARCSSSGAIMFDETLFQSTKDGKPFVEVLAEQGIKPGIKVDTGLQMLPGTDGETATQGLDGMGDRMKVYREQVSSSPI